MQYLCLFSLLFRDEKSSTFVEYVSAAFPIFSAPLALVILDWNYFFGALGLQQLISPWGLQLHALNKELMAYLAHGLKP
jgi:hypothetical protein